MWAPQQVARARHRASLASNRRRGRRIRSGRLRPIIESMDEAHRGRAQAATAVSLPTNAQSGQKTGERGWEARYFSGSNTSWRAARAGGLRAAIRNRDLRGIESPAGDIESISRDFDAALEANRQRKLPARVRSRVAHAVPIAEPSACHQGPQSPETCAQTRDTGYRPFVRNAREAPEPPNGLGVI